MFHVRVQGDAFVKVWGQADGLPLRLRGMGHVWVGKAGLGIAFTRGTSHSRSRVSAGQIFLPSRS